jgi:hypothetical protein
VAPLTRNFLLYREHRQGKILNLKTHNEESINEENDHEEPDNPIKTMEEYLRTKNLGSSLAISESSRKESLPSQTRQS